MLKFRRKKDRKIRSLADERTMNIHQYTDAVDCIVENYQVIQEAKKEIDYVREFLDNEIYAAVDKARKYGAFVRSLNALGSNKAVNYLFKNSFSALPLG